MISTPHRELDTPHGAIIHVSNLDAIDFTGLGLLAALGEKEEYVALIDESLKLTGGLESVAFDPRGAVPGSRLLTSPDGTVRQLMLPLGRGLQGYDEWAESVAQMPGRFASLLEQADTMVRQGRYTRPAAAFMAACYRHVGTGNIRVVERLSRKLSDGVDRVVTALRHLTSRLEPGEMRKFSLGGYVTDGVNAYRFAGRGPEGRILLLTRPGNPSGVHLEAVIRPGVEFRGPLDSFHVVSCQDSILGHIPFFLSIDAPEEGSGPLAVEIARSLFRRSGSRLEVGASSGVLLDEYAADPEVQAHLRSLIGNDWWLFDVARWIAHLRHPTAERWAWSQRAAPSVIQAIKAHPERLSSLSPSPFRLLLGSFAELERLAREAHVSGSAPGEIEMRRLGSLVRVGLTRGNEVLVRAGVPLQQLVTADGSGLEFIRRRLAAVENVGDPLDRLGLLRAVSARAAELIVRGTMIFTDTLGRASIPTLAMVGGHNVLSNFANEHRALLMQRLSDLQRLVIF